MARQEYTMTQEDLDELLEACKSPILIALNSGMPETPQEKANRAWEMLGQKMGFDGMTVEPNGPDQLNFTAEPKLIKPLGLPDKIEMQAKAHRMIGQFCDDLFEHNMLPARMEAPLGEFSVEDNEYEFLLLAKIKEK